MKKTNLGYESIFYFSIILISHSNSFQYKYFFCRELSGYQWIPKADLEKRLVEIISDKDYDNFINTMERLCSLPFAYKAKDFILTYRSPLMKQSSSTEVPKPHVDSDGRSYVTTYGKYCKHENMAPLHMYTFLQNVYEKLPGVTSL